MMEKRKILEICDVYQPKTIATKEFVENGLYSVYGANGEIGKYNKYNHEDAEVLMACRGASCGAINISKPYSWINGNAMVIKPNSLEELNKKYLAYYLIFADKKDIISGTAQPQITRQNLKEFEISICTISEQERIVARIEELFSQLDKSVETLQKVREQLAVYRQAVLKDAFVECDVKMALENVCVHITDGDHMPPPKAETGIPFIMISNIVDNRITWDNVNHVKEEYYNAIGEKRTPKLGDILYTVTGSFGIPVLVDFDDKFCFQRHIALLRPNESILPEFLYYALQTSGVYSQATQKATGTAQKTVGLGVLRKITIPYVAEKTMQKTIVEDIKNRMLQIKMLELTVEKSLQQTEALRQSILKQAFEGKLV